MRARVPGTNVDAARRSHVCANRLPRRCRSPICGVPGVTISFQPDDELPARWLTSSRHVRNLIRHDQQDTPAGAWIAQVLMDCPNSRQVRCSILTRGRSDGRAVPLRERRPWNLEAHAG